MSYQFYKLLHLIGVIILFSGIGAVLATTNGTTKNKLASIANGVGLLVIFVAGFGLMARLNTGFAPFIIAKLFVWLALGILPALIKRRILTGAAAWGVAIALGASAAYLGGYKPGGTRPKVKKFRKSLPFQGKPLLQTLNKKRHLIQGSKASLGHGCFDRPREIVKCRVSIEGFKSW